MKKTIFLQGLKESLVEQLKAETVPHLSPYVVRLGFKKEMDTIDIHRAIEEYLRRCGMKVNCMTCEDSGITCLIPELSAVLSVVNGTKDIPRHITISLEG